VIGFEVDDSSSYVVHAPGTQLSTALGGLVAVRVQVVEVGAEVSFGDVPRQSGPGFAVAIAVHVALRTSSSFCSARNVAVDSAFPSCTP
jgi:hypothetical protein